MDRQSRNWTLRSGAGAVALLATSLCASATTLPIALAEPARAAAVPEVLEDLDEIVLHGKRLDQRIQEEEQRFYQRYNEVNDRPDLDVTCDFYYRDWSSYGSRILGTRRGCVPIYVGRAIGAEPLSRTRLVYYCTGTNASTVMMELTSGTDGFAQHYTRPPWTGGGGPSPLACPASTNLGVGTGPSPELVWMSRRSEFQAQLARVIASDERLQELAGRLGELAAEGRASVAMINAGRQLRMAERRCVSPPRAAAICRD